MQYFLIAYTFKNGSEEAWHQQVKEFIAALENSPATAGKITYRCLKSKKSNAYYHLATAVDEESAKTLGEQAFFKAYTERTEAVAEGDVTVTPLELIAATA